LPRVSRPEQKTSIPVQVTKGQAVPYNSTWHQQDRTVTWHTIELRCPRCERVHGVASQAQTATGPIEVGAVAKLYLSGQLPPALAWLLNTAI
jgi:hypothetical protein